MPEIVSNYFESNNNAWWKFDYNTGLLSIFGYGETSDEATDKNSLWRKNFLYKNIKNVYISPDVQPLTMKGWFEGTSLESFDFWGIDTSKCADMSRMFYQCSHLKDVKTFGIDTSQVRSMKDMFYLCYDLQSIDLSNFNTLNVKDMSSMFLHCMDLQIADMSSCNMENVKNTSFMFNYCERLKKVSFSNSRMNMLNVSGMFGSCHSLKEIDFSSYEPYKIEHASFLFSGCTLLEKVLLNPVAIAKIPKAERDEIFSYCNNLQEEYKIIFKKAISNKIAQTKLYRFFNSNKHFTDLIK